MSKLKYEKGHSKVEGHSLLIREESSGAIINNDITGYQAAVRRKKVFQIQRDEINMLKNEMSDIKQLLGEILERTNGKNS